MSFPSYSSSSFGRDNTQAGAEGIGSFASLAAGQRSAGSNKSDRMEEGQPSPGVSIGSKAKSSLFESDSEEEDAGRSSIIRFPSFLIVLSPFHKFDVATHAISCIDNAGRVKFPRTEQLATHRYASIKIMRLAPQATT